MTLYSAFGTHGNGANGPGSSVSYSGNWVGGLCFEVTSPGYYLQGFYLWRADSGQSATSTFALWDQTAAGTGTVIAATETSGSGFTAGAWNYVALSTPYLLSTGTVYKAVYGYSAGNFPETKDQFDTGGVYSAGITSGPLNVYSAPAGFGGSNPAPFANTFQGTFDTTTASASTDFPTQTDGDGANFWIDVLIGPATATATRPPPTRPVRARLPVPPLRGRTARNAGAPVHNPTSGPPFCPLPFPARARIPQVFSKGRRSANAGAPLANPTPGPAACPPQGPVRARLPQLHPRAGRVSGSPGAPVANPTAGPPARPLTGPVHAARPLPPRGRVSGSPGAPVVQAGPPFYPLNKPARAVIPARVRALPPAGSRGAPVRNPTSGPPAAPQQRPAQARFPPPPRGRTSGSPGAPVQNPATGTGPPFCPFRQPARAHIAQPPRGRVTGNKGAPVASPTAGPVFRQATHPSRAVIPQTWSKGRASGSAGAPVQNPAAIQLRPLNKALRAQPPVFAKGRIASSPGAPVHNPTSGPPFPALHAPAAARALPRRPGSALWRYGVYSAVVPPPPIQPPGLVTITPAGPLAAQVTVTSGPGIPVVVPYTYGAVPGIAVPGLMVPGLVGALYIPFPAPTGASATVTPAGANAATVSITQA